MVMRCAYYNTFYNAEQYFNQGVKELENSPDKKVTVSIRNNFDTAIEKSNKVIIEYPDSRWTDNAAYIIAVSNYYKTNYLNARKSFEQFFANYPNSELRPRAEIWYGRCLYKLGEKGLALHQLYKSSERVKDPEMKAEIYVAMAELYQTSNELDSALFYYEKTTKLGKDIPIAADAQYKIAEINLKRNEVDLAITNLKKVNSFAPSNELKDRMQILLARIYRESGRFDDARELINTKLNDIKNESIWADLELQLAYLYVAEGDYESAVSRFGQITENYSKETDITAEAYYQMGRIYMVQLGDYEKAMTSFDKVKRADRNSIFAFDALQKSAEIQRFFSLNDKLTQSIKKVTPFLNYFEGKIDTSKIDIKNENRPEILKKAIEQYKQEMPNIADTLVVFQEYYNILYELGELYFFDFSEFDSAFNYFNKIYHEKYYNSLYDKVLYAIYYMTNEIGDKDRSTAYLDSLRQLYPNSPYLAYIENREAILPEDNIQARLQFLNGEKWFDINPDSAIVKFRQVIQKYPKTDFAEKSLLNIAWLYQNRLYDIDNSIKYYNEFIEQFPENKNKSYAVGERDYLNEILISLNPPEPVSDTQNENTEKTVPDSNSTTQDEE